MGQAHDRRMKPARFALGICATLITSTALMGCVAGARPSDVLPPAKQAIQDEIDARQSAGAIDPAAKGQGNPNSTDEVETFAPEGRIAAGDGWLFTGQYVSRPPTDKVDRFTTSWGLVKPGENIDVWVGGRADDPERGFVMVVDWDDSRTRIVGGDTFDAPTRHGALTITSVDGVVLTLRAEDGSIIRFDPVTTSWLK
jgi:hypothetical protein